LTPKNIVRMLEVNLVADLLIATIEGIKSKKQIRKYYDVYEKEFDQDTALLEQHFDRVVAVISALFPEGLSDTEFRRPHVFYSLFTMAAHCLYGLPHCDEPRKQLEGNAKESARNALERVEEIFEAANIADLNQSEQQFLQDCRRATTDETVRQRRTKFLLSLIQ
jgi:hypothetical protein